MAVEFANAATSASATRLFCVRAVAKGIAAVTAAEKAGSWKKTAREAVVSGARGAAINAAPTALKIADSKLIICSVVITCSAGGAPIVDNCSTFGTTSELVAGTAVELASVSTAEPLCRVARPPVMSSCKIDAPSLD